MTAINVAIRSARMTGQSLMIIATRRIASAILISVANGIRNSIGSVGTVLRYRSLYANNEPGRRTSDRACSHLCCTEERPAPHWNDRHPAPADHEFHSRVPGCPLRLLSRGERQGRMELRKRRKADEAHRQARSEERR